MSTYSASRRVNGPDHPFNGRLRGYYRGPVPRVLRAIGYDPNEFGYDHVHSSGNRLGKQVPRTGYASTTPR
jgi:hypothetical protein